MRSQAICLPTTWNKESTRWPFWSVTVYAQHVEEGWKDSSEQNEKKLKPDPVPANKGQENARGMEAIIALPKNKRDKMTVEDTITKSFAGQIEGPVLWRVSHKRRNMHPLPTSPHPPPPPTLCSLRSGSHYQWGHTVERTGVVWHACQKLLVCVRPPRLMWNADNTSSQPADLTQTCLHYIYGDFIFEPMVLHKFKSALAQNQSQYQFFHYKCMVTITSNMIITMLQHLY